MDEDRLCNAIWPPESKQTKKVRGTLISLLVYDREMRGEMEREGKGKRKRRGRERECETERKKREGTTW